MPAEGKAASTAETLVMDLVLPDFAEALWALFGFVLLFLPLIAVAVIAVAVSRGSKRREAELRSIRERLDALEQRDSERI